MTHRFKFLTAMICLLGIAAVRAQQPTDSGTIIRTETKIVLVDAVVTDKKGGYMRDLKQKDFKVYEDGKEQQIRSFAFEADPNSPTNQQPRYLILLFDNSTADFSQQKYARDASVKFIDANVAPNRLMAVMEFGGGIRIAQNFTANADRLKAAVQHVKFSGVDPNETQTSATTGAQIQTAQARLGVQSLLLELRALARNLGSIPGRKSLILFTGGFKMPADQMSELTAVIDACNHSNVAVYPIDIRGLSTPDLSAPIGGIPHAELAVPQVFQKAAFDGQPQFMTWPMYLAFQARGGGTTGGGTSGGGATGGSPGRSGGGAPTGTNPGGSPGRGSAPGTSNPGTSNPGRGGGAPVNPNNPNNPNNINNPNNPLNPNNPRNLIPRMPDTASSNQQVMYALADGTGGFVIINTNDMLGGLDKIGKELNEFYLIGYTPPDSKEGNCHSIKVKVDKAGGVRHRTGYCDTKQKDVLLKTSTEQTLETRANAPGAGTVQASMQVPYFYTAPNVARVNVAMEIATGDIKVEKDPKLGKLRGVLNVLGIATNPDGAVAARFSDSVKLDFENQKEVDAFKEKQYHYENQFDIASGKYTLKVVFNSGGEAFGKVETSLAIDPYDGKTFMISGFALSNKYGPAAQMGTLLDAALIEDRTPLVTHGVQVIPSGTNSVKKSEKDIVYLEVYEPLELQEKPPGEIAVALQIVIVDPKNNTVVKGDSGLFRIPMPDKPGNPVISFATTLPTENVEPGSYLLQIKAYDFVDGKPQKAIQRGLPIVVQP